jgi:hypothetical protein
LIEGICFICFFITDSYTFVIRRFSPTDGSAAPHDNFAIILPGESVETAQSLVKQQIASAETCTKKSAPAGRQQYSHNATTALARLVHRPWSSPLAAA